MRIAKDIHRILQGIVIIEELQTARDGEHDLGAFAHVQCVDSAGVFDDVVAWFGDPVVPRRNAVNKCSVK